MFTSRCSVRVRYHVGSVFGSVASLCFLMMQKIEKNLAYFPDINLL